jgi:hypothetical protein
MVAVLFVVDFGEDRVGDGSDYHGFFFHMPTLPRGRIILFVTFLGP